LLLLISPKADAHFTVSRMVLGYTVVKSDGISDDDAGANDTAEHHHIIITTTSSSSSRKTRRPSSQRCYPAPVL